MKYFGDGGSKTKKIDYIDIYMYTERVYTWIYVYIYTQLYTY